MIRQVLTGVPCESASRDDVAPALSGGRWTSDIGMVSERAEQSKRLGLLIGVCHPAPLGDARNFRGRYVCGEPRIFFGWSLYSIFLSWDLPYSFPKSSP